MVIFGCDFWPVKLPPRLANEFLKRLCELFVERNPALCRRSFARSLRLVRSVGLSVSITLPLARRLSSSIPIPILFFSFQVNSPPPDLLRLRTWLRRPRRSLLTTRWPPTVSSSKITDSQSRQIGQKHAPFSQCWRRRHAGQGGTKSRDDNRLPWRTHFVHL